MTSFAKPEIKLRVNYMQLLANTFKGAVDKVRGHGNSGFTNTLVVIFKKGQGLRPRFVRRDWLEEVVVEQSESQKDSELSTLSRYKKGVPRLYNRRSWAIRTRLDRSIPNDFPGWVDEICAEEDAKVGGIDGGKMLKSLMKNWLIQPFSKIKHLLHIQEEMPGHYPMLFDHQVAVLNRLFDRAQEHFTDEVDMELGLL